MEFLYPELGRPFLLRFNYGTGSAAGATVTPPTIPGDGYCVHCDSSHKFEGLTMKVTLNFSDPLSLH